MENEVPTTASLGASRLAAGVPVNVMVAEACAVFAPAPHAMPSVYWPITPCRMVVDQNGGTGVGLPAPVGPVIVIRQGRRFASHVASIASISMNAVGLLR